MAFSMSNKLIMNVQQKNRRFIKDNQHAITRLNWPPKGI